MTARLWSGSVRLGLALTAAIAFPETLAGQSVPDSLPAGTVIQGRLSFDAKATMGDFTGHTTRVSGQFTGGALTGIHGVVEAPADSLATGNGKRDRDMYKSLETKKYPTIAYRLDSLEVTAIRGDTAETMFHGAFLIHGVTRDASFPAVVELRDSLAVVTAETPMNLKDHDIGGLSKFLGLFKMDEHIVIHIEVVFRLERPSAPGDLTLPTINP